MGEGNSSNQKVDETQGFQCLGHSNWTICIPLNPFCSGNFLQQNGLDELQMVQFEWLRHQNLPVLSNFEVG